MSGLTGDSPGKEPACQCRRCKRHGFSPWVRKILWRRKWQPTPVFLPGESHGQRSLVGYSPWGSQRVSHVHAWLSMHAHTNIISKVKKKQNRYANVIAAAAATSLQSCPTLCDPIDGGPPGSPIPGILQARTLEWVAISFSNAGKGKWKWSRSVMSDSSWPHGLQPIRLLRPWDFPGKSTGVGCIAFSSQCHYLNTITRPSVAFSLSSQIFVIQWLLSP